MLRLSLACSPALSGSLLLALALSGSLLLSEFAHNILARLTRPLLSSQRRCNTFCCSGAHCLGPTHWHQWGPPMCSGPPGLSQICKLAPYPPPTPHNNDPLQVWSGFFLMPRRCPILKTIQKSGGANAWRKKFLSLFLKVLQNS